MKAIIFIISISLSLLLGYKWGQSSNVTSCQQQVITEKPTSTDNEIKNCSTEVEQAKKIYGEAFLLFLANIGIQLNPDQINQLSQVLAQPQKKSFSQPPSAEPKNDTSIVTIIPDQLIDTPFADFLKQNKGTIEHIEDSSLVKKNSSFILKDPGVFFIRSKYIESFQKMKAKNGLYNGKIYLIAGEQAGEIHDIELNIDFILKNDKEDNIDGNFTMKLIKEGSAYSTSNGSGGNGNIRFNDPSLIIEAGPNNFFHFETGEISTANFYQQNNLTGFAKFRKVD